MAISLDQIVPWGRSRKEYEAMFSLSSSDLTAPILDCGGGPASFTAEMSEAGLSAVSIDPIYAFSGEEIRSRFETMAPRMLSQIQATPSDWVWGFHRSPDHLLKSRRMALERFLADFETGRRNKRYLCGELPRLPFPLKSFKLAVCSHLLFLYSDLLSEEFHLRSVLELGRVAEEVRLFPILTLRGEPSPHLNPLRKSLDAAGWSTQLVQVDYELQRGGNQMLKIVRAG